LSFSCTIAQAQNYKTHRVKAGQTIESIAKQYKVSVEQLYRLNPDARESLRPNAILIIPKKGDKPKITSTSKQIKVVEKKFDRYEKHKVRRKETLYSLAKKYNITEEDIKKHNKFLYLSITNQKRLNIKLRQKKENGVSHTNMVLRLMN